LINAAFWFPFALRVEALVGASRCGGIQVL
jgi:hypothetical protein